jgi:uncharacterized membrane protein
MIYVEKLTCELVLFLYCVIINEEYSNRKYRPEYRKFEERIDRIIDYYGSTEVLIILLNILVKMKLYDNFNIHLRNDLLDIIIK